MPFHQYIQWPPAWWVRRQQRKREASAVHEQAVAWKRVTEGEIPAYSLVEAFTGGQSLFASPAYGGQLLPPSDHHSFSRLVQAHQAEGKTLLQAVEAAQQDLCTVPQEAETPPAGLPQINSTVWEYEEDAERMAETVKRPTVRRETRTLSPLSEQQTGEVSVRRMERA